MEDKVAMEITICSLCQKRITKPRVLTCMHSFCENCLTTYFESCNKSKTKQNPDNYQQQHAHVQCPSCQSDIRLPTRGLPVASWCSLLPSNPLIQKLVENQARQEASKCDPCHRGADDQDAVSWCYDCGEALCASCTTYHTRVKVLIDHSVLPLSEIRSKPLEKAGVADICLIHPGKRIEAFCFDDDALCCIDCVTFEHRKCSRVDTLEASAGTNQDVCIESLSTRLSWLEAKAKTVMESRGENIKSLATTKADLINKITKLRKDVNDHLQKLEENILREFENIHEEMVKKLDSQSQEFERLHRVVGNGFKVLQISRKYGSSAQIFVSSHKMRKICEQKEDFIKTESGKVFDFDYDLRLNKIVTSFTEAALSIGQVAILQTPTNILPAFMKDMQLEKLGELNLKTARDSAHCWITGCASAPDGRVLLCDFRNKKIKLLQGNGLINCKVVDELPLPAKPWGVAEANEGRYFVTTPDEKSIFVLTIDNEGKLALLNDRIDLGESCFGIHRAEDRMYVARATEILITNIQGIVLEVLETSDTGIRSACANSEQKIAYTSKTSVVACGEDGSETFRYKSADLKSPRCITRDTEGNYYVTGMDSNNVHQLSQSGKLHRLVLTHKDGIRNPYLIGFEPNTNRMYLAQMDSDVLFVYNLVTRW